MGLLCLHLPIRPHGTKFFFFCNETNITILQIFSMYMLLSGEGNFLFAKKRFRKEMQRAYLVEGQERHRARGHGNLS